MLGEFRYNDKIYSIKNSMQSKISIAHRVPFTSLEEIQDFISKVTQTPNGQKEILHIIKWSELTYCRPPKNCPKPSDQELLNLLCLNIYNKKIHLYEVKSVLKGVFFGNCGFFTGCKNPKVVKQHNPMDKKYGEYFFLDPDGNYLGWLESPTQKLIEKYGLNGAFPAPIVVDNNGYIGSLDTVFQRYKGYEPTYCHHYSKRISQAADAASIGSIIASIYSGGTTALPAAIVGTSATVVSVGNGVVEFILCGPFPQAKWSQLTTCLSAGTSFLPTRLQWWGIFTNAIDAVLAEAEY